MSNCARCGAQLGLGRYCTNCGARADGPARSPQETSAELTVERPAISDPTATAERPAVPGRAGASAPPPPPPPMPTTGSRYPLYADEAPPAPGAAPAPPPPPPPPPYVPPLLSTGSHRQDRRGGVPWLVLLPAAVLVVMILVGWLLLRGEDDTEVSGSAARPTSTAGSAATGSASPDPAAKVTGPPRNLTRGVEVDAPRPARPGVDLAGNRVTYPVSNMFDRRSETAYRVDGDAAGEVLTFTLPESRTVTMVGLVNGYAKTDGGVDWYPRQHRITRVAWVFDDGTRVEQDLRLTRQMQQLAVAVETQTVELHILETRPPGRISRARNATSISEVTLQGSGRSAP